MPASQVAQSCQIAGQRLHDTDVLENRLGDQRAHRIAAADRLDRLEIVVVDHVNQGAVLRRNTGADRYELVLVADPARADFRQRRHQVAGDVVMPSVVSPLHHDQVVPAGKRARQSDGLGRGLATRVQKGHLLEERYVLAQESGDLHLPTRWPRCPRARPIRPGRCARRP